MIERLSPAALAHTDELLAKMRGVHFVTSTFLEEWWGAKRNVQRLELFRLLNDLAEDNRIVKLPGRRWCLPANAPKATPVKATPAPVAARKAPPAKPAPLPLALPKLEMAREVPLPSHLRKYLTPAQRKQHDAKWGLDKTPAPTSAAGRILAALRKKPDDGPGLTRRLKMNGNTVRGRLSELSRAGWIEQDAACMWEVTR